MYKAYAIILESQEDIITEQLFAYNAQSVGTEKNEGITTVTAIFDSIPEQAEHLRQQGFTITEYNEDEWKYVWTETYEGAELTPTIYIKPANKEITIDSQYKTIIELDPRDAFGDGRHPTTSQCAIYLEKILTKNTNSQLTLLDTGTGTGVLALVAGKLGITSIDAIDIEKESIIRARNNVSLNKCDSINLMCSDIAQFSPQKTYDIVCANLLTEIIKKNLDHLVDLTKPGGYLIISGISREWHDEVCLIFDKKKLSIKEESIMNEWCCFLIQKPV